MIRLTGGEFRGRSILTPPSFDTRPTQAKLRQALFNSLQVFIPEARVLELFAGSGALGFEAISRGAESVVFVEQSRSVVKLIEKNANSLEVKDRVIVLTEKVETSWARLLKLGPFDIVLADPPYANPPASLLNGPPWDKLMAPNSRLCIEWSDKNLRGVGLAESFPFLVKVREKNYGDTVLTTYALSGVSDDNA